MTLESIYYIGQTIAVAAILGSLVAIYAQQRQANKIARMDMSQRVSDSFAGTMRELMTNKELASTFRKVMFERSEPAPVEATQILIYFNLTVAAHADAFLAHSEGLIDRRTLEVFDRNTAWYLTAPVFAREWQRFRRLGFFEQKYRSHVDAQFARQHPAEAAARAAHEMERP